MRHSIRLLGTLGFLLAACGPGTEPSLDHPVAELAMCTTSTNPLGVDVSHGNGVINWGSVADSGIGFGIAKATEGLTFQDPQFPTNWPGMKQNGVVRGAYHYFHYADNGTQQADYFLAYVGAFGAGDLPPFLVWEDDASSPATAIANAQLFIDEIAAKTGLTTIIYTYPNFWTSLGNTSQFGAYPVWYASYGVSCPSIPAPWTNWLFWQYNTTGTVSGIPSPGALDLDVFNGTLADLIALTGTDGGVITPPDGGSTPDSGMADSGYPDSGNPQVDAGPGLLAQVSGNEALTLVNWTDGHMELFARTPSGAAMHAATTGTGDSWSALAQLDTGAECGSAAAFWGGAWVYPELFSPRTGGTTGHLWWTSGTGWNVYQTLTGATNLTHLSTLTWVDGHVSAYALGTDGTLWENAWDATASNWPGWASIGGANLVTGAGTIMKTANVGELFATDSNGAVWHTTSTSTGWATWTQLGGATISSRPFPVRWADDHVSVYARGADHLLYTADFSSSTPSLSAVDPHTKIIGDPSALMNASGPTVVTRLLTGQVVQSTWTGSGYTPLAPIGVQVAASDPFAWLRGDGRGEVFAVDSSGAVVSSLRDPSSGWGTWSQIGTGIDPCSLIALADGGLVDAGSDAGPQADGGDGGILLNGDAGTSDAGPNITYVPSPSCGCATGAKAPTLAFVFMALVATWRRRTRKP